MKKRMLITTIVMMLVLAVALTTSSLAWFTASQATVTATGGTFTASTAGSATNIGLAQATDGEWASTIAMLTPSASTKLMPLCPQAEIGRKLTAEGSLAYTNVSDVEAIVLNGARMLINGQGQNVFPLGSGDNAAYTHTLGSQAHSHIYAKNLDTNGTIIGTLKVTLKITGTTTGEQANATLAAPNFVVVLADHTDAVLRMGLITKENGYLVYNFEEAPENTLESTVLGTSNANIKQGDSTIGKEVNQDGANITFEGLEWGQDAIYHIHVYAWYEGQTLNSLSQSCSHTFDLTLEATKKA